MRLKKLLKTAVATTLAAVVCLGAASVAKAAGGQWMESAKGWWYKNADGSYQKDQWMQDGGKWYYFDADGYMDCNGYRQGFWLNADGSYDSKYSGGKWYQNNQGWWWADKSGWYPKNTWVRIDGKYYYFHNSGYLATDSWIGNYYVDKTGAWDASVVKDGYSGTYAETIAGRGFISIIKNGNQHRVTVTWPESAAKYYYWEFTGSFDSKGVMSYKGATKTVYIYDTDGNLTVDEKGHQTPYQTYADGTGTIKINGSKLEWVEKDRSGKQIQKSNFNKNK